jgi:hypothetical protein
VGHRSCAFFGAFGLCFWANQADDVQASGVSSNAIFPLLSASPETPETAVSAEPGSAHAGVSLTNDELVYN